MKTQRRSRQGLASIEVIVIVAVVGLCLVLILLAVGAMRSEARRARCINNLKQIALAADNYHSGNECYPMSEVLGDKDQHGVGHSAFVALLPFMEASPDYNDYNFDVENWCAANDTATRHNKQQYLCPENDEEPMLVEARDVPRLDGRSLPSPSRFGRNHYGVNWGGGHRGYSDDFLKEKGAYRGVIVPVPARVGGKTTRNIRVADITDGVAHTLAFVEKRDGSGWAVGGWSGSEFDVAESPDYSGGDVRKRRVLTGSPHGAGPNAAFCDGSVKAISKTIDRKVWYGLMTRDGAEVIKTEEIDGGKP